MSCMLNMTDILELIVDSLYDRSLAEHDFVMKVHERVLHVLLDFCDQVYVIHEKAFEEILADITPVGKDLSEKSLRKFLVFQRLTVIAVPWRELPLDDFPLVVDDQMKLESVEPSHRALSLLSPAFHGLVHVHPLDMAGHQRSGVDDGDTRAFAQGACLKEQEQVKPDFGLALYESVVGDYSGELFAHVPADVAQIERFQIAEVTDVEQDEDGHDFTVRHASRTVPMPLPIDGNRTFLQFRLKIFAEFVEKIKKIN